MGKVGTAPRVLPLGKLWFKDYAYMSLCLLKRQRME